MKETDPETDLKDLFRESLGEKCGVSRQGTSVASWARNLTAAGLEQKILAETSRSRSRVLQKQIEIPFGFQNGRLNLIHPVRFESANPEQSLITACKYAVEGQSLYENPHAQYGEMQLFIVGKFRPKDEESLSRVRRVFQDYNVKLYWNRISRN